MLRSRRRREQQAAAIAHELAARFAAAAVRRRLADIERRRSLARSQSQTRFDAEGLPRYAHSSSAR